MMTIGSLFSGIGGLELGLERAGLGPVIWQAESDEYAREVLARHWPGVPVYKDVRDIDEHAPRPDLICGGFL
jgi:DNA (cytosine-5)-methyltransferase 1